MHIMNNIPTAWSIFSIFLFSGIGLVMIAAIVAAIMYFPARKRFRKEKARVKKLNNNLKRKEEPTEIDDKFVNSFEKRKSAATIIITAAALIGIIFGSGIGAGITTNIRKDALSHSLQIQAKERYGIKLTDADTDILLGPAKYDRTGLFTSDRNADSQKSKTVMYDSGDQENSYQLFGIRDLAKLHESGKVKITKIQLARVNDEYILTYNGSAGMNDVTELPVKK